MSHYQDRIASGFLVLQHHDGEYEVDLRLVQYACRMQRDHDQKDMPTHERGTMGDLLGGVLWYNRPAGQTGAAAAVNPGAARTSRDIPAWSFGFPSRITGLATATVAPGTQSAGELATLPLYSADDADNGFNEKLVTAKPAYPGERLLFPKGWHGVVHSGTAEYEQQDIWLPAADGLVCTRQPWWREFSSLVYDVEAQQASRPARLHSVWQVEPLPAELKSGQKPAGEMGLAWLCKQSGAGQTGYGFAIANGDGDVPDDHRGRADAEQDATKSRDADGDPFAGAPGTSLDVLMGLSHVVGGPIHPGHNDDQHLLGTNIRGRNMNAAHISTSALYYYDRTLDAPLDFEPAIEPTPKIIDPVGQPVRVHLQFDAINGHGWAGGGGQGLWRWHVNLPIFDETPPLEPPGPPGDPGGPGDGPGGGGERPPTGGGGGGVPRGPSGPRQPEPIDPVPPSPRFPPLEEPGGGRVPPYIPDPFGDPRLPPIEPPGIPGVDRDPRIGPGGDVERTPIPVGSTIPEGGKRTKGEIEEERRRGAAKLAEERRRAREKTKRRGQGKPSGYIHYPRTGTFREWTVGGLAFPAIPHWRTDPDEHDPRYNKSTSFGSDAMRERLCKYPMVARIDSWGYEVGGGGFVETDNGAQRRYGCPQTSVGGIMILPPETGMEHYATAGMAPPSVTLSDTYFALLSEKVYLGFGEPDPTTGGIKSGYVAYLDSSDRLVLQPTDSAAARKTQNWRIDAAGVLEFVQDTGDVGMYVAGDVAAMGFASDMHLGWGSDTSVDEADVDVALRRESANTLGVKAGYFDPGSDFGDLILRNLKATGTTHSYEFIADQDDQQDDLSGGTTETTIAGATLGAGYWNKVGATFRLIDHVTVSGGAGIKTFRAKLGGTTLATFVVAAGAGNVRLEVEAIVATASSASGRVRWWARCEETVTGAGTYTSGTLTSFDTQSSASHAFIITGQLADAADTLQGEGDILTSSRSA